MHSGNSQAGLPENMLHHSRHPPHQVAFILSSSSLFRACIYFQCDLTMSLSSLWFSKCGSYPPESCLFSLIGNVGAFMGKTACSHSFTRSTPAVTYRITENSPSFESQWQRCRKDGSLHERTRYLLHHNEWMFSCVGSFVVYWYVDMIRGLIVLILLKVGCHLLLFVLLWYEIRGVITHFYTTHHNT